jgi:hypothetical protein
MFWLLVETVVTLGLASGALAALALGKFLLGGILAALAVALTYRFRSRAKRRSSS